MRQLIKKVICLAGIICILFVAGYFIRQNSHVRFKDENMGIVICNTIGRGVTPENVRYKDLKKVQNLSIGCVGCYTTLLDIKKCTNIKDLRLIDLSDSQISTADSLKNLQDPMRLCIFNTPLAENEEEIQKHCEVLPNTEILISGDRVENEQNWDLHEYYSRD